jgi:hypothetical protein
MNAGLRALLGGVVDYAGLFPPAKLPLDESVRNYARYRTGPDAWMLGRFVVPAARLAELEPYEELFRSGPPFGFTALGRGGATAQEFLAGMEADAAAIEAFRRRYGGRVAVDALEARLPAELLREPTVEGLGEFVTAAADVLGVSGKAPLTPYYEAELGPAWKAAGTLVAGIARDRRRGAGFKLRCGGLEAAAFPPSDQVAYVVCACRDAGVPLKFTAGLHHPLRRPDAGLGTKMHGFVNVFAAGVLAHARGMPEGQVRRVVEDEDAGAFAFSDDGLRWRDFRAGVDEVAEARRRLVVSFGSCSFDEPRDDLRALGWL